MILTGLARLGADAEVRYTPGGDPVANLYLAWNYGRKDGEGKRPSQWISASLWGDRATTLQQYLTKGTALDVVLEDVHVETYDRRDGGGPGVRRARHHRARSRSMRLLEVVGHDRGGFICPR